MVCWLQVHVVDAFAFFADISSSQLERCFEQLVTGMHCASHGTMARVLYSVSVSMLECSLMNGLIVLQCWPTLFLQACPHPWHAACSQFPA